ncbi:hypothetical protein L7F22_045898 [Adiantum nelumboides]|nr:hypothetical protein [Adiantum nelumboides]
MRLTISSIAGSLQFDNVDRRTGKEVILGQQIEEPDLALTRRDVQLTEEEGRRRRSQIVFFDLETTVASGEGDKPKLLEFGAVVLASQGLRELQAYSTLVRQPGIFSMGAKFNLAQHRIVDLPSFDDIADQVFDMLHGRIWAGHNIIRFDMVCIRDAFATVKRPSPQPAGVIDTLPLLRETFGPRAGDLKMASLAKYCGLGKQKHRSLADVRLNVDVLKHCATMLFLVVRRPKFRTSIEMKRASLTRPLAPSTSSSPPFAMRRQPQVYVHPRLGQT